MTGEPLLPPARRRFKPYSSYKDSGVQWLGRIPAHWDALRLKFATKTNPTASDVWGLAPDTEVSFVPMEAVGEYGGLDLSRTKHLAEVGTGYTCFRDGDVLVAKITPCFENGKGAHAAGLANGIAFGTTELHVVRSARVLDDRFLFYVTLSSAFRRLGEGEMYGAGGQKRVPESFVKNLQHPLPPLPEQSAIADLLDRETARIDGLVAKKERLIGLLEEKRAGLITRALTNGLDPTVPMRDSGVEWLGQIPAHWNVCRLKDLAASLGVGVVVNPSQYIADEGVPFLYGSDIAESRILTDSARRMSPTDSERLPKSRLHAGDLLMVRVGSPGVTAMVPLELEGANCASVLVIRQGDRCDSEWLCFALNSRYVRFQVEMVQYGAAQEQFNVAHAVNFLVAVPPSREQRQIRKYVQHESAKLGTLTTKVREAIDRLKELRSALISAAVTGKIDVRAV